MSSPLSFVARVCRDLWCSRSQPVLVALLLFDSIVFLYHHLASRPAPVTRNLSFSSLSNSAPATTSCEVCVVTPDDPLCAEYGSTNVRLSRAYEGSGYRVRRFLEKAMRGEEVRIGVIGASVSLGHGLGGAPTWHAVFLEGFKELFPLATIYDGSAAAMDSEFYSFCVGTMLPLDLDLYLIELDINNESPFSPKVDDTLFGDPSNFPGDITGDNAFYTMKADDALFRSLLELPQAPAVIRVSAFGLSFSELARGFASSLVLSQHFDVPIVTIRNFLLPHLLLHRNETAAFFAPGPWQETDLRHIGVASHQALGDMLTLYMREQACEARRRQSFPFPPQDDIWPSEDILRTTPSVYVWDKFLNPTPPPLLTPSCNFTISKTHPLLPLSSKSWTLVSWNDKFAWQSSEPNAVISFAFTGTRVAIFVWSGTGRGMEEGPGSAACWVGGDLTEAVVVDSFEAGGVGRPLLNEIAADLPHGEYMVTCQVMAQTSSGGTDFRIMGVAAQ